MRKLKLQVQMTVDGFIAGPQGEMDWVNHQWGPDINDYVSDIVRDIDLIVMGKNLASGFIPYWAGVAADDQNPEVDAGKLFTDTPKVVFSSTVLADSELAQSWPNTRVCNDDLAAEIAALKRAGGSAIYACGGSAFTAALIAHDLVDEYNLFINPVAIGKGMPIFHLLTANRQLKLQSTQTFECRIVALRYERP